MTMMTSLLPETWTAADVVDHLGGIPASRIRVNPAPGTATEEDLVRAINQKDRLWELIDGVLVEKAVGYYESRLALVLCHLLELFARQHDLGILLGPDGPFRLGPGQIRLPDVAFFSWHHFPDRRLPRAAVLNCMPDLAVEILSPSNTAREMDRKRAEYLRAGVRLIWYIDPEAQTAQIFTADQTPQLVTADQALDGGAVLPGFHLPLRDLFRQAGEREEA